MRVRTTFIIPFLLCVTVACGHCDAGPHTDPRVKDLFRALLLRARVHEEELGRDVLGRAWDFGRPDRGNFTVFGEGVGEVSVSAEKALCFTAEAEKIVLGWGNYAGRQPVTERVWIPWGYTLVMKVRQSTEDVSTWGVRFRADGESVVKANAALLHGTKPQMMEFSLGRMPYTDEEYQLTVPDGFELEIEGPERNEIEIMSLGFYRRVHEGRFRRTVDLGDKTVWRAMASVSKWGRLCVNGQEVETENSVVPPPESINGAHYNPVPVDLAPYLKPGRNCVAIHRKLAGYPPFLYLQGRIIFTTGESISLDTDRAWRGVPRPEPGWATPDFDDSDWRPAKLGRLGGYYTYMQGALPAYDGRLVIESPDDSMLFFDAAKPVRVRVRTPVGLRAEQPSLEWSLQAADFDGEHERAKGTVDRYRVTEDSLVYEIDCGRLPRGVYALAVSLRAGDRIIESRPREPLVVLGRIPMKEVEGLTYEDGMDLTLAKTIDFTDPQDPHRWIEGDGSDVGPEAKRIEEPRIVRKNGLAYRETRPSRSSFFSYQFEFKRPGDFYLMVLDYPNDAERWIGVSTSTSEKSVWTHSKAGPSIWTGDKYPLTNTMQEHRWIYRSDYGPHTIDIISMQNGSPAAASRLRIYHVKELPALKIRGPGQRKLGILTERTTLTSGFGKTFGLNMLDEIQPRDSRDPDLPHDARPMEGKLRWLVRALDACEHYTRYLRFTGQNLHAMGCFQYSENNTPFAPRSPPPVSRVSDDIRDLAIRVFGHNGIDVIASVEYTGHNHLTREYYLSDAQVAAGADTPRIVSKSGKQHEGTRGYYGCWNFVHPRVQKLMKRVASDVLAKFRDRPNFRGLNWTAYMTGEWLPNFPDPDDEGPFAYSYDDATIHAFEQDTGVQVPISPRDPRRFRKRALYLTSETAKPKFVEWRCQKVRELFLGLRDLAQRTRPDLDFFASLYFNVPHARTWSVAGRALRPFMRECGYAPTLYRDEPHLWLTRWTHATVKYTPAFHFEGYAAGWRQNVDKEFIGLYEQPTNRGVMIMHHWDENSYTAPGANELEVEGKEVWELNLPDGSEWPLPFNRGRLHAQPNGDFAREAFTQALATSDPEQVLFGFVDVNLMVGNEQPLREFARVLRTLPRQQLKPALGTSLKTNLAIRGLSAADGYYFTVANPGTWPIEGIIEVAGATAVMELASGREVASARTRGSVQVQVSLPPFGVSAFRADSAEAKLVSWQTKPVAAKHLSHMHSLVQRAQAGLDGVSLAGVLLPDEIEFLRASTTAARQALSEGKYALAWSAVTHWRFWTLLKLLKKGTPSEPVTAERHVIYEPKPKRIVLWGSDEATPFRPSDLLAADQREGWGIVRHDTKTDTTRVNAGLVIGRTDGTSTYFQIGSADHARETLVLKGDLRVAPPKLSGTRRDGRPFTMNRLQLGHPERPDIKATLKFGCAPPDKFGIQLGVKVERDGRATWRAGGSLRVYHSTITALEQDWLHAFAWSNLMGSEVHLVNSTVSWCGGLFAYGVSGVRQRRIEGTTFEYCAQVLYNGHQRATDCVFRHCGVVAAEGGRLSGTFERCTFRDNGANFTKSRPGEIQFIDCDVGPQRKPLILRPGEDAATGRLGYPSAADVRTLIVSVVDDDGRPIPGAAVDLVCGQSDETAVLRGFAITDRDGRTPGARDRDRLLFTERRLRAARSPTGHEELRYTYRISVLASGFERTELSSVKPQSGISRLRVVLQRQE